MILIFIWFNCLLKSIKNVRKMVYFSWLKKKYDEHGDEEDEDSYMFLDFSYEGDECIWINFILFYD